MAYGLKYPERVVAIPDNENVPARLVLKAILSIANDEQPYDGAPWRYWLTRIHRYGITKKLVAELNEAMQPIKQRARPILDFGTRKITWKIDLADLIPKATDGKKFVSDTEEEIREAIDQLLSNHPHPKAIAGYSAEEIAVAADIVTKNKSVKAYADFVAAVVAYEIAFFLEDGVFEYLRRCQRPECKKFYLGGPRSKWCSDNCGGIVRTKAKRKRDKVQGAMI